MAAKPNRKAPVQINIRVTADEAATIRAGIPRGDLTPVAAQLLLDEARTRLRKQLNLEGTAA